MQVKRVVIRGFRNLREESIAIRPGGSFIIGKNGQGKTNVLEAIYYLSTMKSFRTNRDTELINFEGDFFRIRGEFTGKAGDGSTEVAYDGKRKIVKVDGAKAEKVSDAFGVMKIVVMTPDDVDMIRSYPSKRRRFLDIVLSMTSRKYLNSLTGYKSVLRQRNALLREGMDEERTLSAWDVQMCVLASEIAIARNRFMNEYSRYYRELNEELAGVPESSISYMTCPRSAAEALEEENAENLRELYESSLRQSRERDRVLGTTTIGPHRDNVMIKLKERDMKQFGSQGQQSTSVFALRIAEALYIEEKTGERPILLMDDVLSQLDRERGKHLMELVRGNYQTIITTPRRPNNDYMTGETGMILVDEGELTVLE